ncbi:MAG: hypothetical protein M3P83_00640 [Actinomycetota bacterium]|nr:hypothetical protein [Actinomycetota bacterium]
MPLADPFELPEWLAEAEVVWESTDTVAAASTVSGRLTDVAGRHPAVRLDLLAVDAAWPRPVAAEPDRCAAHQAWHYGEVALLQVPGGVALGVPGAAFSADLVSEAVRRFARAVGAKPQDYAVRLRL